jgi:hypothetical protein
LEVGARLAQQARDHSPIPQTAQRRSPSSPPRPSSSSLPPARSLLAPKPAPAASPWAWRWRAVRSSIPPGAPGCTPSVVGCRARRAAAPSRAEPLQGWDDPSALAGHVRRARVVATVALDGCWLLKPRAEAIQPGAIWRSRWTGRRRGRRRGRPPRSPGYPPRVPASGLNPLRACQQHSMLANVRRHRRRTRPCELSRPDAWPRPPFLPFG